jgi:hypothetical protein
MRYIIATKEAHRGGMMKIERFVITIALLSCISGCYSGITGRVIDAETQQPIEGAVVLVEWTKKHGFGEYWTESYKVVETMSDKEGNVQIEGCNSPFVEPPDVTIYKKGYVVWNNKYIFPDQRTREDFKWQTNSVFEMKYFKSEYSHDAHISFINGLVLSGPLEKKKRMLEAIKLEEEMALEERRHKK